MTNTDGFGLIGQMLDARYNVEKVVGEGGFGVVYRATQVNFEEPVAIKVLKISSQMTPERAGAFVATFRAEGRHLRKLSTEHPAFVKALDTGVLTVESTGQLAPYLVLEWLEGAPLDTILHNRRAQGKTGQPLAEVMASLAPIAGALAHAHEQRVAHRDLKPANIFMATTKAGTTAKLLDFGMAKVMTESGSEAFLEATQGGISGLSPAYAAPEQWQKKLSATGPWTDVYAFALTLVEMLTDRPVLVGDDLPQLCAATLDPVRPTPTARGATVTEAVEAVFAKALAIDPRVRHSNVGEFWRALEEAARGEVGAAAVAMGATLPIDAPTAPVRSAGSLPPAPSASAPAPALSTASAQGAAAAASAPDTSEGAARPSSSSMDPGAPGASVSVAPSTPSMSPAAPSGPATKDPKRRGAIIAILGFALIGGVVAIWKGSSLSRSDEREAKPESSSVASPAPSAASRSKVPWWKNLPDAQAANVPPSLAALRKSWLSLRDRAADAESEKKVAEAESLLKQALDVACKQIGRDDPSCPQSLQELAEHYAKLGKFAEAEKCLREALALEKEFGDPDGEDADDVRKALMAVLTKQGKTAEAQKLWKPGDEPLQASKAGARPAPASAATDASAASPAPASGEQAAKGSSGPNALDVLNTVLKTKSAIEPKKRRK